MVRGVLGQPAAGSSRSVVPGVRARCRRASAVPMDDADAGEKSSRTWTLVLIAGVCAAARGAVRRCADRTAPPTDAGMLVTGSINTLAKSAQNNSRQIGSYRGWHCWLPGGNGADYKTEADCAAHHGEWTL